MGKYSKRSRAQSTPNRNAVNPYMRGIGCLLMLIVPVFSFGVGNELAEQRFGHQVLPPQWYDHVTLHPILSSSPALRAVTGFLEGIPHLSATLALTVVVMILVGGILSVIFGWMYSIMAPSKYGPMDVPPPRVKTKKYKR